MFGRAAFQAVSTDHGLALKLKSRAGIHSWFLTERSEKKLIVRQLYWRRTYSLTFCRKRVAMLYGPVTHCDI